MDKTSVTTPEKNAMTYTVEQGVICSAQGLPLPPHWFADSRLAFQYDVSGITQVDFYNPTGVVSQRTVFLRRLWEGFRCFLEDQQITYAPEYLACRVWPFGLEAEWRHGGGVFRFQALAVAEAVVLQIATPAQVPNGVRFKLELYEAMALIAHDDNDHRFAAAAVERAWQPWEYVAAENSVVGGYIEQPRAGAEGPARKTGALDFCFRATFPVSHWRSQSNPKHILRSEPLAGDSTYSFILAFASGRAAAMAKAAQLSENLAERVAQQFARYTQRIARMPELVSPYPALNDFMRLAPLYHEALKVTDYPGAVRAKTTYYWVWGWDGLTSNYASLYWGDAEFIRDMLRFYETTADPEQGIVHAYDSDMRPLAISALPAQGLYITLLHLYYAFTGDAAEVRARYPFARTIFERIRQREVRDTGLCEGTSLYPDYADLMQETHHDLSAFNNVIFYCAARGMESLATLVGDDALQQTTEAIFRRLEQNFVRLFFNSEKGFVVSSIDSVTLAQRDNYNLAALKWENSYCTDLIDPIGEASLAFMDRHCISAAGLREQPVWSAAYDGDANQLHCWWPVTGEAFMRLINQHNRPDLIEQWVKWVSVWTRRLICPEGISYYVNTPEPVLDAWNCQPNTWQAYSMRGWYQAAMHGVVGLDVDAGGITFHPYAGRNMQLNNLAYAGRVFDIEMRGRGRFIKQIEIGALKLRGSHKLPVDVYGAGPRVHVTVRRTDTRVCPVYLESGYGVSVRNYHYAAGKIDAQIEGCGVSRLYIGALAAPEVRLAEVVVPVAFDAHRQRARVEVHLKPGETRHLEITAAAAQHVCARLQQVTRRHGPRL